MALQIKTQSARHLFIGYIALALLFIALWFVDTKQIDEQRELINYSDISTQKMRLLADLIEIARKRVRLSHEMISSDDLFEKDDIYLQIEGLAGEFSQKLIALEKMSLSDDEKKVLNNLSNIYPKVIAKFDELLVLVLEETQQANIIGRNIIINEIVPMQETIVDGFMNIMNNIQSAISEANRDSTDKHEENTTYRLILVVVIFVSSLGVLFKVMNIMIKIETNLQSDSLTDGLTGIANRRCFDHMLLHEWKKSQRTKHPLSLLLIDIDYFKKYNDFYGHQQGDQCLVDVSKIIKETSHRESDISARYGGEEFALILPETDTAGALKVANTLLEKIRVSCLPHKMSDIADHVTLSIGIATSIATSNTDIGSLIKTADEALYKSKANGRNQATIHTRIDVDKLT